MSDTQAMSATEMMKRPARTENIPIEFTPQDGGEFQFTCGMGMLRDELIVH